MAAWNRAEELASTYSTKQNGSVLTIQILFTKGIHYILNINTFDKTAVIDSSNSAYEIKISPYYCSLLSSMSSNSICTLDTEVVTIYNKLGYKFNLKIPQKLTIENIIFDMIEGIIPWINDPSSVLTKRINACQYNNSTKKMVNNTSSESWSLRNTLTDSCARSPKYHMFTFMNNNSSSSLPFKFIMTNVTILNVFYNVNSLVDFNAGGYVNMTQVTINFFSNWGAILKNTNPSLNNFQPSNTQNAFYIQNYNQRATNDAHNSLDLLKYKVSITNSLFQSFNYLKYISGKILLTNQNSGNTDHGYIIHLLNFNGRKIIISIFYKLLLVLNF